MMIRRRMFCRTLAGAGIGVAYAAAGQTPAKVHRLGILVLGNSEPPTDTRHPILAGLARLGLVEGVNLVADVRIAHGKPELLDGMAADLVAARPDALFTGGGFATARALKKATTNIPIVFAAVGEPVAAGLVASLARPGGNLTGGTIPAELEIKRVQILMEVLGANASVVNLTGPLSEARRAALLEALAPTRKVLGTRLRLVEISKSEELDPAFEQMARERVDGVAIRLTQVTAPNGPKIIALAAKHRLAAIADGNHYTDAGLLMSYSIDWSEINHNATNYVYKILMGAWPADLPIQQPSKFDFVINMRTARTLGVRIPPSVLAMATRVTD